MDQRSISITGIGEAKTFHSKISDSTVTWLPGIEDAPQPGQKPKGGIGFLHQKDVQIATIHTGKYSMWVRMEMTNNATLYIAQCYFPNSRKLNEHRKAWKEVETQYAKYCTDYHVIIMGDFNCHTRSNGDKTKVDPSGTLFLEKCTSMNLQIANHLPQCTDLITRRSIPRKGKIQESTIDYVLTTKSLLPFITGLDFHPDQMGSDHKTLLLTLQGLEHKRLSESTLRQVWKTGDLPNRFNETLVKAFSNGFDSWRSEMSTYVQEAIENEMPPQSITDQMESQFREHLNSSAEALIGKKTICPGSKPKIHPYLKKLNQMRIKAEDRLRRVVGNTSATEAQRADAIQAYRCSKRSYFQAVLAREELLDIEIFEETEKQQRDSKILWSRVKRINKLFANPKAPPPMVESTKGQILTDPIQIKQQWHDFFANMATTSSEEEGKYDEEFQEEQHQKLRLMKILSSHQPELDQAITEIEVFRAIRKLEMGKAPGHDNILTDILRHAAGAVWNSKYEKLEEKGINKTISAITFLFNYIFTSETWPASWSTGTVLPLHKKGNVMQPENYRPITLLPILGKIFGSVLVARLQSFTEEHGILSDCQGGFRRGRSTTDQIFTLREIIMHRQELREDTYVAFIDIRKAYDTVWRECNYVNMFEMGIYGKTWRQIQKMNAHPKSKVRLPIGTTETYQSTRGLAQGAVESPWAFNCFINNVTKQFEEHQMGVTVNGKLIPALMYADDIVILATSTYELQTMLDMMTSFAFKNRLQYNNIKSNVMAFTPRTQRECRYRRWHLFGKEVEVTESYEYLGIDIQSNIHSWTAHFKKIKSKAQGSTANLIHMCKKDRGLLPRTAMTLWKAKVRPQLEYACELWHADLSRLQIAELEAIQIWFAKEILGISGRGLSHTAIRAELGLESLQSRWTKLSLGYWRKIHLRDENGILGTITKTRYTHTRERPIQRQRNRGWFDNMHTLLIRTDLSEHWEAPKKSKDLKIQEWKSLANKNTNHYFDEARRLEIPTLPSLSLFNYIKDWDKVKPARAFSSGEMFKLGALKPEAYLDTRKERPGAQLKLLCRLNGLPLFDKIGRERDWPIHLRICPLCGQEQDDRTHLLLRCQRHSHHREKLFDTIQSIPELENFTRHSQFDQLSILLGCQLGNTEVDIRNEEKIDLAMKRFLRKIWRPRQTLVKRLNKSLGRTDPIFRLKQRIHFYKLKE